jgi:hypothetical protein
MSAGRWCSRYHEYDGILTGYKPKNAPRLPIKAIPTTTTSGGEAASMPLLKLGISGDILHPQIVPHVVDVLVSFFYVSQRRNQCPRVQG